MKQVLQQTSIGLHYISLRKQSSVVRSEPYNMKGGYICDQ